MSEPKVRSVPPPLSIARWFEVAAAACLLSARLALDPKPFWKDWVILVCAWWIATVFWAETRIWKAATAGLMLWLFGLYLVRQVPFILDGIRFQT